MSATIKLGFAPTRRAIFSAPAAVEYRNLTAARLKELGIDFVDKALFLVVNFVKPYFLPRTDLY